MQPTPGSAPIMPGRYVSAKRLRHVWGNFAARRHNSIRLLRRSKPSGRLPGRIFANEEREGFAPQESGAADLGQPESGYGGNLLNNRKTATGKAETGRLPRLAPELVKEIHRADGEHAEKGYAHCHCEIHRASGDSQVRPSIWPVSSDELSSPRTAPRTRNCPRRVSP